MIKSLFGLSISGTSSTTTSDSESGSITSSDTASSAFSISETTKPKKTNASAAIALTLLNEDEKEVQELETKEEEVVDEDAIKEAVQSYGEQERLAPFRTKQILKKALKSTPPSEPTPDVSLPSLKIMLCHLRS